MADDPGHNRDAKISVAELLGRYEGAAAPARGHARRRRPRRTAVLATGGVAAAAVLAGAVAFIVPGSDDPQVPVTASDNDADDVDASDGTATATDVTRPVEAQPVRRGPWSEPAANGLTGPDEPTPAPTAVTGSPQQDERDGSATRATPDAPDTTEPPASRPPTSPPPTSPPPTSPPPTSPPPTSPPPTSQPPSEEGPLGGMLRPILD